MLHGVLPRSGTNLLYQILLLHPDCTEHTGPVREGFLLEHSDQILQYVTDVASHWTNPKWGVTEKDKNDLVREIGDGMLRFLSRQSDSGKRLVSKTPSTKCIHNGPVLFRDAKFVILIRDGRSLCESTRKSWGVPIHATARRWRESALAIEEFQNANANISHLVRYESLLDDRESVTKEMLSFLELSCDNYPFDKLGAIPILGSSDSYSDGWSKEQVHDGFAPGQRWKHWTHREHAEFNAIAGEAMKRFGYSIEAAPRNRIFSRIFGAK